MTEHWYNKSLHARLSQRTPKGSLSNWSRWELKDYLNQAGVIVTDNEDLEELKLAVKLHYVESRVNENV